MLIPVQQLVDRLRHPRSRADEIASVRKRLVAQRGAADASPMERDAADELRRLREAMARALGNVTACGGCARGHPLPHGRFSGGHCCGAPTGVIWTDDELAALRLSGTTPERLVPPPRSDHAGCAFRGADGCSLAVADRPNLCVRFLCRELEGELRDRGDLRELRRASEAIATAFERLRALRQQPVP